MIRNELRKNEKGEPEIWTNLGDLLDWLDTLPTHTDSPVAAGVALEIKRMLVESVGTAEVQTKGAGRT